MQWTFDVTLDPNGTPTTLTNVQSVSVNTGRQALMDNFRATTATIVCRYPNGYASPISGLIPGAQILISMEELGTGSYAFDVFSGEVTDVQVEYGIPYVSNVGNDDYLTISVEGALAKLARTNGNEYLMNADYADNQLTNASTQSGVPIFGYPTYFFDAKQLAAKIVTGSWADWLNNVAFTFAGRIDDNDNSVLVRNYQPSEVISTQSFSDVTGVNKVQYDKIDFDTLAQNYYTQVTVVPVSLIEEIASTGSAPYRNLQLDNNLSRSQAEAQDLAQFYLNNYDTPSLQMSSIHVNMNDPSAQYIKPILDLVAPFGTVCLGVSRQVSVTFRGTTYTVIIEGAALSASPGQCGITLYVSGADLNAYLVLDDPTFGKLDSNKLGF